VLQALRVPDFRLLWGGSLISSFGSWLLVLAIPAHIFLATGSLRDTGLALAAEYLPLLLLGPVAGVFADRWDKRRLMIAANSFCAAAVAAMLLGTSPGRYWVIYAALVAENSGAVLYAPAVQARTPAIVGTGPLLSSANALNSVSSGTVRLIGGPLGGILLASCGIRWLICADAFSYLLSAAAMFLTSRTHGRHICRQATISGVARDLARGIRVLRAQPVVRALLPVTVIFLAANASLSAILIPFGVQRLGGSADTGFLLSCLGVGFLTGAPVIRTLLDRAQPRLLLTATLTATAAGYYLLFTSSSLATALPAAAAVGMTGSMSLVILQTVIQRAIPDTALGRVSAVFLTCEAAATLTGAAAGPFLAQAAHLAAAATAASLVTLSAAALACLTVPRMPAVIPGPVPAHGQLSDEVVALLDVLDETGVGGLPAQELLSDGTGGGHIGAEQVHEHALVLRRGQGPGGQVQVPADGLGDLADGHTFVADRVEHRTGGRLLDGQPVKTRGVLHVDGGPAAGPVADVARDAPGPGHRDELGDEPVTFALAMHRAGQHDQAGADIPLGGGQRGLHVGDAGRDGPGGDEFVAFGRGPAGPDERSARDHHGLAGASQAGGERLDGPGIGPRRSLGHAGHDEGQVDDAVAAERTRAKHIGVIQVAAQHLGAHAGDGRGGGL
jgi:predicted MFS family arabinose efflux permease